MKIQLEIPVVLSLSVYTTKEEEKWTTHMQANEKDHSYPPSDVEPQEKSMGKPQNSQILINS